MTTTRAGEDHVCAIEYYWVDIGHNLYALVSGGEKKSVEMGDKKRNEFGYVAARVSLFRLLFRVAHSENKRNCHVYNESLKYELNRQRRAQVSKELHLMKCNFGVGGRRGEIVKPKSCGTLDDIYVCRGASSFISLSRDAALLANGALA